jgi:putative membrane protein
MQLREIFKHWILTALGIFIASFIFSGISYRDVSTLILAVLLLSACSSFVKPLLMLFAMPLIVFTFGLGIWFINAFLFLLVAKFVDGFDVNGFGYALAGAAVVSLTSLFAKFWGFASSQKSAVNIRMHREENPPSNAPRRARSKLDDDDVIDV